MVLRGFQKFSVVFSGFQGFSGTLRVCMGSQGFSVVLKNSQDQSRLIADRMCEILIGELSESDTTGNP